MTAAPAPQPAPAAWTKRFAPSRFCWEQLNRDDAAELWDELIDWVGWFRIRYEVGSEIPDCWFRHSRAVEELTALMVAHRAAYDAGNGEEREYWSDLVAWHTYHLRPFLAGLKQLGMAGCSTSCGAIEPATIDWNRSGIHEYIGEDVQRRPAGRRSDTALQKGPTTLSPKEVKERVIAGSAIPVDPADPNTAYKISRTEVWRFDAGRKVFVVDETPSSTT